MLIDLECAKLCQSLYDDEKIFDIVADIEDIDFAIKDFPSCTAIIFEGSHDLEDWRDDFDAHLVRPAELNGAGVHHGFYSGLAAVFNHVEPHISKTKPIYCIGHSLGAGRAHIFAAMLIVQGYNVVVVAFGSPRPGDDKLAEILEPFPNRSYWNYHDDWDHDIVGDVPVCITPLFRFVVPQDRILIDVKPEENDPWGKIMGWHHIKYYVRGLSYGKF